MPMGKACKPYPLSILMGAVALDRPISDWLAPLHCSGQSGGGLGQGGSLHTDLIGAGRTHDWAVVELREPGRVVRRGEFLRQGVHAVVATYAVSIKNRQPALLKGSGSTSLAAVLTLLLDGVVVQRLAGSAVYLQVLLPRIWLDCGVCGVWLVPMLCCAASWGLHVRAVGLLCLDRVV